MPREHRFFVEAISADVVELPADQAHHATGVLRLKSGQEVEVFDGAGGAASGTLKVAGRGRVLVHIVSRHPAPTRPEPIVELAFAVPKGKRLDWLLEKATELGAARLVPVVFERSVARPEVSEHAHGRWRGICIAAAKQCGLYFLPEIAAPVDLRAHIATVTAEIKLLGSAESACSVPQALSAWSAGKRPEGTPAQHPLRDLSRRVAILVGPEGGLTEPEQAQAQSAGFVPVRLGSLTLRVETAAIALLATVRVLGS